MILLVIFLLCLHLSSGVEITNIHLYNDHLYTKVGSRLVIPCMFDVDESIHAMDNIDMEWGVTPEEGGAYRSVVRSSDTTLLPLNHPNERAHVISSRLRRRICSMVIDPTNKDDGGTYELRLTINGIQFQLVPKIQIHVMDGSDITGPSVTTANLDELDQGDKDHSPDVVSQVEAKSLVTETIQDVAEEKPEDKLIPEAMWYIRTLRKFKKGPRIENIAVAAAIIIFLLLIGCIAGCFCGAMYMWMRQKKKDPVKAMEEGRPSE